MEKYYSIITQQPTAWKGHFNIAINIVEEFKPKIIVDLGVDYGFSTFSFAYPKIGQVIGIDWFKGDQHCGVKNTYDYVMETYDDLNVKFGIDNITIINNDFNEEAKKWTDTIDILHIDGLHTLDAVTNDYNTWSKFTNDQSIILFHDVVSFKSTIGHFFNELKGFKIIKPDSAGLGILCFNEEIYNRILKLL